MKISTRLCLAALAGALLHLSATAEPAPPQPLQQSPRTSHGIYAGNPFWAALGEILDLRCWSEALSPLLPRNSGERAGCSTDGPDRQARRSRCTDG